MRLQLRFVIFGPNEIGVKAACKMLVQLTTEEDVGSTRFAAK